MNKRQLSLESMIQHHIQFSPHIAPINITLQDLKSLQKRFENALFFDAKKESWHNPYFPFLDILSSQENLNLEHHAYPGHKDLFSFLLDTTDNEPERIVLHDEYAFERTRCRKALISMLMESTIQGDMVIILNARYLDPDSRDLLLTIGELPFLVIAADEDVEQKSEWSISNTQAKEYWIQESHLSPESKFSFLEKAYTGFSSEYAEILVKSMIQEIEFYKIEISDEMHLRILEIAGLIDFFNSRFQRSKLYLERALNVAEICRNYHGKLRILGTMVRLHHELGDIQLSEKNTESYCLLASEHGNQHHKAFSKVLEIVLLQFKSLDERNLDFHVLFSDKISLLEEISQDTLLAYLLTDERLIFYLLKTKGDIDYLLKVVKRGVAIAEKNENVYRLSVAHTSIGIIHQSQNNMEEAIFHYRRAKYFAQLSDDSLLISRINNSLGYFNFSQGYFAEAASCYEIAYAKLLSLHNYADVFGSMFNFAALNFFSLQVNTAAMYYDWIIRLMKILRLENLAFHPMDNILSLQGICSLKMGNIQKAYDCFYQVEKLIEDDLALSTFEYYHLLKGELYAHEQEYEQALEAYYIALHIQEEKSVNERYLDIYILYSIADAHRKKDNQSEAESCIQKAIELCGEQSAFSIFRSYLHSFLSTDESIQPMVEPYIPKGFSPESFEMLAVMEMQLLSSKKSERGISLLLDLQSRFSTINSMLSEADMDLCVHLLEELHLGRRRPEETSQLFQAHDNNFSQRLVDAYWKLISIHFGYNDSSVKISTLMNSISSWEDIEQIFFHQFNPILLSYMLFKYGKFAQFEKYFTDGVPPRSLIFNQLELYLLLFTAAKNISTTLLAKGCCIHLSYENGRSNFVALQLPETFRDRLASEGVGFLDTFYRENPDTIYSVYEASQFTISVLILNPKHEVYLDYFLKQLSGFCENLVQKQKIILNNLDLEFQVRNRTKELEESLKLIQEQESKISQYARILETTVEQRTNDLLQAEKLASLGSLVAGLAHEINTPLGIVLTSSSFLKDLVERFGDDEMDDDQIKEMAETFPNQSKEALRLIELSTKRVSELVNSFKKLSIDQKVMEEEQFFVREYIDSILTVFKPRLKKFEIDLNCDSMLKILSYPGLYYQVVSNIILNSIIHAYGESGEGRISISVLYEEGELVTVMEDFGAGMTDEVAKHIYEPFFTTKRNRGGTGLGLNIVHNIVTQNLSGTIRCDSQLGIGTKFTISFPVTRIC
jgi:signal transduction histidine kinase